MRQDFALRVDLDLHYLSGRSTHEQLCQSTFDDARLSRFLDFILVEQLAKLIGKIEHLIFQSHQMPSFAVVVQFSLEKKHILRYLMH